MLAGGAGVHGVETVVILAAARVESVASESGRGPAAAAAGRREQDALLADVAEDLGGRVVRRTNAGFLAAFPSAGGALAGAIRMQQMFERRARGTGATLRIGISMGDAEIEDGDYRGLPVVEAETLCGVAGAGEILVGDPVRSVLRDRGPHQLAYARPVAVAGLELPAGAWRLAWTPLAQASGPPLPPRLRAAPEGTYVGRAAERATLLDRWARAVDGQRQMVVVAGEPGIGKTRLVTQLAQTGLPDHALVLYGRCDPDQGIPYHPWREILRDYAEIAPRRLLAPFASELSRLVPGLSQKLGAIAAPASADPDTERYLLFSAVESMFAAAAESMPVLAIVDDLHWADRPTLLLLEHLVSSSPAGRLMFVGTFRDSDVGHDDLLTASLANLRQAHGFASLSLVGLDAGQIADLMAEMAGAPIDPAGVALAREVHRETAGNPFFVGEVLRHLQETGAIGRRPDGSWSFGSPADAHRLPQSVREVIERRLQRLSREARRVLAVGAVIGTEFDRVLVGRAADLPAARVLELLEEAVDASLLARTTITRASVVGAAVADGYAFSHGLVQATLYDGLPRGRRAAVHQAVGEAIEATCGDEIEVRLAELAHHFLASADGQRAVDYAGRAGRQAMAEFAYDRAAALFAGALAVRGGERGRGRIGLLQALGDARMRAGDSEGARRALRQAADAARRHEDPQALARAVRSCEIWGLSLGVDVVLVRLAEEAIVSLESWGARRLVAEIKGLLAVALYYAPATEAGRRERLATEALAAARAEHAAVPDRASLASLVYVLGRCLLARWGPQTAIRDFGLADELLALCRELGDGELELFAHNWRNTMLGELGEFAALERELAEMERLATELRQPRALVFLPLHRGMLALVAGRFAEVERRNAESVEIGRRIAGSISQLAAGAQMVMLRLQQGRLPEIEEQVRRIADAHPDLVPIRCALIELLLQAGRPDRAREEFERVIGPGLELLPCDNTHILSLCLLADAAVELADAERAQSLYAWLEPYGGRWVVVASDTALWPVDRSLGRLAGAIGRAQDGLEHLAAARRAARQADAAPSLALLALDEARIRAARGGPDDLLAAARRAEEADALGASLGMRHVVEQARRLQVELGGLGGGRDEDGGG